MRWVILGFKLLWVACMMQFSVGSASPTSAENVTHRGFEDFSKGTLGNSGVNLFVTHDGTIQVINQRDFNGDGYNDLMFSSDHDAVQTVDAFVYWGSEQGYESLMPELWRDRPLATVAFGLQDGSQRLTRLQSFGGGKSIIIDLNKDGWSDIVFCNYIHNYPGVRTAYVYWRSADGYHAKARTELPTRWAAGVAAADLNGDGYPELIFANQGTEAGLEAISKSSGMGSFIYWGSATGFGIDRRTEVPTHVARDVAVADVNRDGYPDLAFINNGGHGRDVQVFLGSAAGYEDAVVQTVVMDDPMSIEAGDFNRDGFADLVITTSASTQTVFMMSEESDDEVVSAICLLPGSAEGIRAQNLTRLPAMNAKAVKIFDLNNDGWPEIAVANSGDGDTPLVSSYIYWGSPEGHAPNHRTELPTLGANSVASGDLNNDGFLDLVFANSNDGKTYDVPSYIYWGSDTGFAPYLRSDLQGFGAVDVNATDLNSDGIPEVVLVNQYSGKYGGKVNSLIYWGNAHHYYSTASLTKLPGDGSYGTAAADLNGDGYCDIVLCNSYADDSDIFWGSKDGFSPDNRQTLPVAGALSSKVADLNKDGWLDLAFFSRKGGETKNLATIYWGTETGLSERNQTVLNLNTRRASNITVADLNRDGWLDLICNDDYFGTMQIVWGSDEGYSIEHSWSHATNGGSPKLADLDGDGVLDFIVSGGFEVETKSRNSATRIYRGTEEGTPSFEDVIELEAYTSCEVAVADLNRDGYLDLVSGNYMSDSTRSLPIFVFWGGPDGSYSNENRLELPAESSCGVETLDLNRDGYPEIIVHNHLKDGNHTINSYVYWNGPDGLDRDRRTELPTFGPHYTMMIDAGNLYTRKLEETYVSVPIAVPDSQQLSRITWDAEELHGSKLHFQVRSARSSDGLDQAEWHATDEGRLERLSRDDRWIQYRAVFTSPDAAAWPVLERVVIEYE